MEPIDPRVDPSLVPEGSRPRIVNAPDKAYRDLPTVITPTGYVISRWALTDDERRWIAMGEDVYVTLIAPGGYINPLMVTVGPVNWQENENAPSKE